MIRVEVAVAEKLAVARDIVSRRYAWRGYLSQEAPDSYSTLLAYDGKNAVGTVTLGLDWPLLAMVNYGKELEALRGRRVCELVRLAIEDGADSSAVWAAFLRVIEELCAQMQDLVIEVNPRHVGHYCRALNFEVFGPRRKCARSGAASVLLRLSRENFQASSTGGKSA